ncbi:hypothetical protein H4R33_001140 [Dimargaris cristalligena]|uniref:Vacuolar ATPase assembly protein VMA22 n=1 Tax=Dimargaris cristalligena TaxID=215637 RepID=A0A4V1J4K3_9FUNG|nr:hypothetical protein H4R33_001140 [Dimargaris cristalligena]RKP35859.1 hypothetical protein BJ085DRAFT_28763 [Dimargaris cristalligena]|eukprot:RKP35859.1 hypothetical protein BJ085DRAFT_28763 [Dimargaris cristalligena]
MVPMPTDSDELVTRYFSLLEAYEAETLRLGQAIAQGHWALTETKKVLGPGRLSSVYYDQRMKHTKEINIHSQDASSLFELRRHEPDRGLGDDDHQSVDPTTGRSDPSTGPASSDGLRQRPVARSSASADPSVPSDQSPSASDGPTLPSSTSSSAPSTGAQRAPFSSHDPIHWFGVLHPPALKRGQTHFNQSLQFAIRLANLKQEIGQLADAIQRS